MAFLILVARILFSAVFIMSGVTHFTNIDQMTSYAASKGVPAPRAAVLLGGIMILLGGISVLLGIFVRLGALLLVAFLIPTALLMHNFWTIDDPQARQVDQAHFMKDLALAGAAFLIWYHGTGPWSLGG